MIGAVLTIVGGFLLASFAFGAGWVLCSSILVNEIRRYRNMHLAGGDREAVDRLLRWMGR